MAFYYARKGQYAKTIWFFTMAASAAAVYAEKNPANLSQKNNNSSSSTNNILAENSIANNGTSIFTETHAGLEVGTALSRSDDLSTLLNQRFFTESSLNKFPEEMRKCEIVKKKVINTPKLLPSGQNNLERVIKIKEFKIICVTPPQMQALFGNTSNGRFESTVDAIFLTNVEQTNEDTFNHEGYHADTYYRNKPRAENPEQALTPVSPYTEANIKDYNKNFDMGDKRIREFAKLRQKQAVGERLSKKEQTTLKRYTENSEGCVPTNFVIGISQREYHTLATVDWKNSDREPVFLIFGNTNEKVEVVNIRQEGSTTLAVVRAVEPAQVIVFLPDKVQSALEGLHADKPEGIKLAEREAYTFDSLSESAIKTFYTEASRTRQRCIKKTAQEIEDDQQVSFTP